MNMYIGDIFIQILAMYIIYSHTINPFYNVMCKMRIIVASTLECFCILQVTKFLGSVKNSIWNTARVQ